MKFVFFSFLLLAFNCQPRPSSYEPALLVYFNPMTIPDTLHIEVASQQDTHHEGQNIPNDLFFGTMPKPAIRRFPIPGF